MCKSILIGKQYLLIEIHGPVLHHISVIPSGFTVGLFVLVDNDDEIPMGSQKH